MREPRTVAGRALHEALRRGTIFVRSWDAEGKDYSDYAASKIAAIEAEAAELDIEALAEAIAQSLVTDGYIDLDRNDGELYLNGEPNKARGDDIRLTAESIAAAYREAVLGGAG